MIQPFDDTYFMKKALQEAELAFKAINQGRGSIFIW